MELNRLTKLADVVRILADGEMLPREYLDHELQGKYKGHRECHIESDWLLIYKITESVLVLSLVRTGSHSRLFRR